MIVVEQISVAFNIVNECSNWTEFNGHRNKEAVRIDVEKLLYQVNKGQIMDWNMSSLDQLVVHLKLKQDQLVVHYIIEKE